MKMQIDELKKIPLKKTNVDSNNFELYKILDKILCSHEMKNKILKLKIIEQCDKNLFDIKNFYLLLTHSIHSLRILLIIIENSLSTTDSYKNETFTLKTHLLNELAKEICENSRCVICTKDFIKKLSHPQTIPLGTTRDKSKNNSHSKTLTPIRAVTPTNIALKPNQSKTPKMIEPKVNPYLTLISPLLSTDKIKHLSNLQQQEDEYNSFKINDKTITKSNISNNNSSKNSNSNLVSVSTTLRVSTNNPDKNSANLFNKSRNKTPNYYHSATEIRNKSNNKQDLSKKSKINTRNKCDNINITKDIQKTITIITNTINDNSSTKSKTSKKKISLNNSRSPITFKYKTNVSLKKIEFKTISSNSYKSNPSRQINFNTEDCNNSFSNSNPEDKKIDNILENLQNDINYLDNLLKEYSLNLEILKNGFVQSCCNRNNNYII